MFHSSRIKLALSALLFACGLTLPLHAETVDGSVIVNLKPSFRATAERHFAKTVSVERWESSGDLADFMNDYALNEVEPVFVNVVQQKLQKNISYREQADAIRRRFSRRSRRADPSIPTPDLSSYYVLKTGITDSSALAELIRRLQGDPRIESAHANPTVKLRATPNDKYFLKGDPNSRSNFYLWGLQDFKMNMKAAWDLSTGEGATVAVVDTGFFMDHPDKGLIDTENAYDFVGDDRNHPVESRVMTDPDGHGSHVTGTINAAGNNSIGIIGVAYRAKVLPVKMFDKNGYSTGLITMRAVQYAADKGADVINMSFGDRGTFPAFDAVLQDAASKGCVLIAAAGNENEDASYSWPNSSPYVINVAATDIYDFATSYTNYGPLIDVAAPGHVVMSFNVPGSNIDRLAPGAVEPGDRYYLYLNGTSMAAPHVSGLAALLLSQNQDLTATQIRQILRRTADNRGDPVHMGAGRVNAYKALSPTIQIASPADYGSVSGVVVVSGTVAGGAFASYQLEYGAGTNPTTFTAIGPLRTTPVTAGALGEWSTASLPLGGTYTLRLRVTDNKNNTFTKQVINLIREDGVRRASDNLSVQSGVSLDATQMVWADARVDFVRSSIYRYDFTTHTEQAIDPQPTGSQTAPSVFQQSILYIDNRRGNRDLYEYNTQSQLVVGNTTTPADENDPQLSDNWQVWEQAGQIYLLNRINGFQRQITTTGTNKKPKVNGGRVVWVRTQGNEPGIYIWDMHRAPQEEKRISPAIATVDSPAVWGDYVVWEDRRSGQWQTYLYDLNKSTGTEKPIGSATSAQHWPTLWNTQLAFTDLTPSVGGDIYLYDIVRATTKRITYATGNQHHVAIYGPRLAWIDERYPGYPMVYYAYQSGTEGAAPTVSLTLPELYRGTVTISATVASELPLQSVRLLIDHSVVQEKTQPPYQFSLDTKKISNGAHHLSVEARDSSGQVGRAGARMDVYNPSYVSLKASETSNQTTRIVFKVDEKTANTLDETFADPFHLVNVQPLYPDLVEKKKKTGLSGRQLALQTKQKFADRALAADEIDDIPDLSTSYAADAAVENESELDGIITRLKQAPGVLWAQREGVGGADFIPNDLYFNSDPEWGQNYPNLWGLKKYKNAANQDVGIDAEHAWDLSTGTGVIVAVVDTGVYAPHPDIAANLWHNQAEVNGRPGVDDDNNGFVDDIDGWNFIGPNYLSPSPGNNPNFDNSGHGTHVAGTIAAVGNNVRGVVGVAYKAQIMMVRVLDNNGRGTDATMAAGIRYAVDNGAKVINTSFGISTSLGPLLAEALAYAASMGRVVVASAGNDRQDTSSQLPSASPYVISVSATDASDGLYSDTNFGPKIDVAAPGVDILSLTAAGSAIESDCRRRGCGVGPGYEYLRLTGTSMAAPHVSGVAALLLSRNPTLSTGQVRQIIRQSADDRGAPGRDDYYGYGRLNALKAVQSVNAPVALITEPQEFSSLSGMVSVKGAASGSSFAKYQLEYGVGSQPTSFTAIAGEQLVPVSGGTLGSWDTTSLPSGTYTLQLRVTDKQGRSWTVQVKSLSKEDNVRRLSSVNSVQEQPALDGTRAVWTDNRDAANRSAIYVYDFATQQEKRIDPQTSGTQISPAILGNTIVYLDNRRGNFDLYTYDLKTQTALGSTSTPEDENAPFLNDNWLVYERDGKIYLSNSLGGTERIVSSDGYNIKPSLSQRRVVWLRADGDEPGVYLYDMDVAPQKERRLSEADFNMDSLRIYKDLVIWEDTHSGQNQTYVYDLRYSTSTPKPIGGGGNVLRGQQHWPAIFENTLVQTEYPSGFQTGYLMQYNLLTGTSKRISSGTGLQHHAAIYGSRVLWMDERSGTSAIYMAVLGPDTEAPVVSFATDLPESYWRNNVTVEARAVDNMGVQKVRFKLNNQVFAEKTAPPYSYTFNTLQIPNGAYALKIEAVDAAGNVGVKGSRVDIYNINRLGFYTLAPAFALDLTDVRVYPSPWRVDQHNGKDVTFANLTEGSTVKIFTLSGRHVRTLSHSTGVAPWNLKNDSGDTIASGLYLYLIEDNAGHRARGKFAVIR